MNGSIARTLESIVTQRYSNLEIIVIDGASDDGTLDQINRYKTHIAMLVSEPDGGIYDAVNKGLRLAKGDIIGILNGDDYYQNAGVIDLYVERFCQSEAGVVFGDLEFFAPSMPSGTIRVYSSKNFKVEKMPYGWMPPHPTMFARRRVYEQVGEYCTDYDISADFEFVLRALWKHRIPFDRVDAVVVRMQYGGLSTKSLKTTYLLNREIIRACMTNGVDSGWLKILSKFPKKILEFMPVLKKSNDSKA